MDLAMVEEDDAKTLVDRVLWRLGYSLNGPERSHDRFWQLHDELALVARSAGVSSMVNEEAMRGLSANYFEQLEMVLSDSLAFATWALTSDHVEAERPFHYDDDSCRAAGIATLQNSSANIDGPEHHPLEFGEKVTLYGLARGFAILAGHLRLAQEGVAQLHRDRKRFPRFAENTLSKRFPFGHTVPFLDLTASAQKTIVEALDAISADLVRARVSDVRNSQIHYRRAASDIRPLVDVLEVIRVAVRKLEDLGFVRILFTGEQD